MGRGWQYTGSKLGLDYHSFGAAYWCQIASFLVTNFIFWVRIGIRQAEPVGTRRKPSGPQIAHHFRKAWPTRRNLSEPVGDPNYRTTFGEPGPRSGFRGPLIWGQALQKWCAIWGPTGSDGFQRGSVDPGSSSRLSKSGAQSGAPTASDGFRRVPTRSADSGCSKSGAQSGASRFLTRSAEPGSWARPSKVVRNLGPRQRSPRIFARGPTNHEGGPKHHAFQPQPTHQLLHHPSTPKSLES